MTTSMPHTTLASSFDQFIRELDKSPLTIQAYRTDIQQFIIWLSENDLTVTRAHQKAEFLTPVFYLSGDKRPYSPFTYLDGEETPKSAQAETNVTT